MYRRLAAIQELRIADEADEFVALYRDFDRARRELQACEEMADRLPALEARVAELAQAIKDHPAYRQLLGLR